MKVLLITSSDPVAGLTGVGTYVRDLADALTDAGHEVAHLFIAGRSWRPGPRLNWAVRHGRLTASVENSPVLPEFSSGHPLQDISHPLLDGLFREALLRIRPDLVHVHDLCGIPAAFVSAAKEQGFPVVISLHDFWPFCQRLHLIRPGFAPCDGSNGGRNCARYCSQHLKTGSRMIQYLQAITPSAGVRPLLHWAIHFRHRLRGRRSSQFIKRPAELAPRIPDPSAVAAHAAREASFRRILLQANLLLTVSNFARAKYIQHGYPDDRIRVIPLSTKFAGRVGRRVRAFRGYPVRFGFLGRVTPWKGAHIFAEAARGLSPEHARCTFYGEVEDEDRRYLSALAGGHPGIEFKGRYGHDLLEGILEEIDVLVFPSIMSETQGLVGLEAQAAGLPIIASERGAIPEYVHHETNGLLFSSGNASSLRTQMLRIIEEPDLIARLSSNVAPPQSMGEHVDEVIRAYEDAALVNAALVQS